MSIKEVMKILKTCSLKCIKNIQLSIQLIAIHDIIKIITAFIQGIIIKATTEYTNKTYL
jgi:hypothetical protein